MKRTFDKTICGNFGNFVLKIPLISFDGMMRLLTRHKKKIYWRQKFCNAIGKGGVVVDETGCEVVIPGVKVHVVGTGNRIVIDKRVNILKKGVISISIFGDNNTVIIGNIMVVNKLRLDFGDSSLFVHHSLMEIGSGTSMGDLAIQTSNSNATVKIGNDCMFSTGITVYHTDGHPVYDIKTGKIINKVGILAIGNHVWVGKDALILKNVVIPDGCIIARNAVVTKKFDTPNSVIAGNPAAVKKTGIAWKSTDAAYYENNAEG